MTPMFRFLHKRRRVGEWPIIFSSHDGNLLRFSRSWSLPVLDELEQIKMIRDGYIDAMHLFAPVDAITRFDRVKV